MVSLRYVAFSHDPDGGNPAGVVLDTDLSDESAMQAEATRIGYSETAFLSPIRPGEYDIRYFSPAAEVPFCGHATVAAAVALGERDPDLDEVVFRTRTAAIPVRLSRAPDHLAATLTSPEPEVRSVTDELLERVLACFGWGCDDLDAELPISAAFAGAWHLILPVRDPVTLGEMTYDFEALGAVMLANEWTTVAAVRREAPDRFRSRNAFPVGGIVEDPATGAAAAALGGYLRVHGRIAPPARVVVHQGFEIGRPSELIVDVPVAGGIDVTGQAVAL